jgi:hypothetical protein
MVEVTQLDAVDEQDAVALPVEPVGEQDLARRTGWHALEVAGRFDAVADALASGASSDVSVFGDHASVTVGELTVRLRREDGIWRIDGVQQQNDYDYEYGYD